MGRQRSHSRQARRAQERRQGAHAVQSGKRGLSWSVIAGGVVVLAAIVLFGVAVFAGTHQNSATGATPQPTFPPGPPVAGIGCDGGMSGSYFHIHAHLEILNRGKPVTIDSNFGHDLNNDCLFWVHAHQEVSGLIHLESPHKIAPTLATWRKIALRTVPPSGVPTLQPKPGTTMKVWVNGKPYQGDPLKVALHQHENVWVEYGPPFVQPTPFNWKKYQV